MKTINFLTAMFATLFIANIALASGNLRVDILPLTAERAVVAITNAAESKFEISILNAAGEKMNIRIYDGNSLVYSKALGNTFSVNEGLNLSKLETGNYEAVLATGDQNYEYAVQVK